jgi:hypothetical protein
MRAADASGGALHEDRFTWLELRTAYQREVRGEIVEGECGSGRERDRIRQRKHVIGIDDHRLRHAASEGHRGYAISSTEITRIFAHDTGQRVQNGCAAGYYSANLRHSDESY